MRTRCLHEIYIQPKMFYTIGFHHQGIYCMHIQLFSRQEKSRERKLGYPLIQKINVNQQQGDNGSKAMSEQAQINAEKLEYCTRKFNVNYNEQQFVFTGGCRFRLETYEDEGNGEEKRKDKDKKCGHQLFLIIRLVKNNGNDENDNKEKGSVVDNEASNGMHSTENIVKHSQKQETMINTKMKKKKDEKKRSKRQKKQEKQEKQNTQEKLQKKDQTEQVSEVIVTINTQTNCISNSICIYQTVVFPQQQYFGKLFYLINYIRIGYKIRPHYHTIDYFDPRHQLDVLEARSQKQTKYKYPKPTPKQLVMVLSTQHSDICQFYKQYIIEQIKQLHRIMEIQNQFIASMERTNNATIVNCRNIQNWNNQKQNKNNKYNKVATNIDNKRYLIDLAISLPDQWVYASQQSLYNYYQCQNSDQLYLTIYSQSTKLSQFITLKWHSLITHMSNQKLSNIYIYKTLLNFKQQREYLNANRVVSSQREIKSFGEFVPQLRYRYFIHDQLPFLYIKKKMKDNKMTFTVAPQFILFVLVHGLNGSQHDMSRIKSFIGYFSNPHVLVLKNIAGKISERLDIIGKTAAQEIKEYLRSKPLIRRINFIGFSLGGVIARACLPYLKKYYSYFNMLITFSSPHLGVKELNSCIIKTGMNMLHHLKGIKNIKELMLFRKGDQSSSSQEQNAESAIKVGDNNNGRYEDEHMSYLQKLSSDPSIKAFNLVVLCGAENDNYVPSFSATCNYHGDNPIIITMMNNLRQNIRNLHQVYVRFDPKNKGGLWDRLTGRKIHINFLGNDSFLYFFLAQYFHMF